MRRILVILVAALVLWFVGGKLRYAFASPETQIRWRLEEMAEGFNTTVLRKLTNGLHKEYRDDAGFDKSDVANGVCYAFLNYVDSETKVFTLHMEVPDEDLSIEVLDLEPPSAWVRGRFQVTERKSETEEVFWDLSFRAYMEEGADGWQMTRTEEVNHHERPSRAGG